VTADKINSGCVFYANIMPGVIVKVIPSIINGNAIELASKVRDGFVNL
jgi:hypothetical protein